MSVSFLKKLHERNKQVFSSFPDKELAEEFIDQLFRFLFLPKQGRNQSFTDVQRTSRLPMFRRNLIR